MTTNKTSNSETLNPVSSALDKALSEGRYTDAIGELLSDDPSIVQEQEVETPAAEVEEVSEETPETTEAEDEVLSQEETDKESEEEESSTEQSIDEGSKGYLKRIDKLTAQKYKLKEELEAKESELKALREAKESQPEQLPQTKVQDFSSFAESLKTEADLIKANDEALEVILWTEDNPDGGIVNIEGKEIEVTAEMAKTMRRQAIQRRAKEIPQRANWLVANDNAKAEAEKKWEWVKKPTSEEYRMAQQLLSRAPQLAKSADYPIFLGYMVEGLKAEKAGVKAPAVTAIKKAPPIPKATIATPATSAASSKMSEAKKRFINSKHSDDGSLTSYIREAFI